MQSFAHQISLESAFREINMKSLTLTILLSVFLVAITVVAAGKSSEREKIKHCKNLTCAGKQKPILGPLDQCYCGCLDEKYMQSCTSLSSFWDSTNCVCLNQDITGQVVNVSTLLSGMFLPVVNSLVNTMVVGFAPALAPLIGRLVPNATAAAAPA